MINLSIAIRITWLLWCQWWSDRRGTSRFVRGHRITPPDPAPRRQARKPDWARQAAIRLKALQPDVGCRTIATTFNRLHADRHVTVGKSWVADTLRNHRYEIVRVRQRLRGRTGRPGPLNRVWALDLTGKTDTERRTHRVLGLIDHGTRACLALHTLPQASSIAILRVVLNTIDQFGRPLAIRTDNETIFTSRRFRWALAWIGIRHQTTDPHCPWMNGRIERFFLTLKQHLDGWAVPDWAALDRALIEFRCWYNHVRPHQSLYGHTPAEIWSDTLNRRWRRAQWFSAWDGLLNGFYIPP